MEQMNVLLLTALLSIAGLVVFFVVLFHVIRAAVRDAIVSTRPRPRRVSPRGVGESRAEADRAE